MRRFQFVSAKLKLAALMAAAMPIACAAPAHAAYVEVKFSGQVLAANPGTDAAFGAGAPITFDAIFDPAKLVDHTTTVNDDTGLGFSSVLAASLSDDPKASLTIKIGSTSFSKYDEVAYGTPEGDGGPGADLGLGNFPAVTYLNGAFAGVGNMFINADGYSFDADPIADAFGGFDLGDGAGGYQFFLGKTVDGDPFAQTLAVGDYDAAAATFTAVPEPAAWLLMLAGFGGLGGALRRTRGLRLAAG